MTDGCLGVGVATAAAALFCALLIFLALQVRAGRDPAIGAARAEPRQVIVRRVVKDNLPAPSGGAATSAPAPVVSRGS
jgi:hypothetical protein